MCREGAAQLMAYKNVLAEHDISLVAIAKERLGLEEFVRDHWTEDVYFDGDAIPGPIFEINDAGSYKWAGVASYLFRGAVYTNHHRAKKAGFKGNVEGEGTYLGGVYVIHPKVGIIYHHIEKVWGDHPPEMELKIAVQKLVELRRSDGKL